MLTGQIGAALVRGIQSQGVMAQAKHYIAFDGANNVQVDPQTLRELYAAPFADVVDAGVASIMCSYNRVNGAFSCGNAAMLNGLLRGELGFQGFVTSDWGATHAAEFINAGLDMEMPGELRVGRGARAADAVLFLGHRRDPGAAEEPPGAGLRTAEAGSRRNPSMSLRAWSLRARRRAGPRRRQRHSSPRASTCARRCRPARVTEATITQAARRILQQMQRFGLLERHARAHARCRVRRAGWPGRAAHGRGWRRIAQE